MTKELTYGKIIGLDIDDTLTDYYSQGQALMRDYPDKLGTYDFMKNDGWIIPETENNPENTLTADDMNNLWKNNSERIFRDAHLNKTWLNLKDKVIKPGYSKVIIITARPAKFEKVTKEWLSKMGIQYDKIVFVSRQSKMPAVKKYNLDMFIADEPSFFKECTETFGTKITRVLIDKSYNHDFDKKYYDFRIERFTGNVID